jgi:hypothetical protein
VKINSIEIKHESKENDVILIKTNNKKYYKGDYVRRKWEYKKSKI